MILDVHAHHGDVVQCWSPQVDLSETTDGTLQELQQIMSGRCSDDKLIKAMKRRKLIVQG